MFDDIVKSLERLAEAGDPGAQYRLGVRYRDGDDVPKDEERAAELFREAAKRGHANAQHSLGVMYRDGVAEPEDGKNADEEAFKLFEKAAEQGHVDAQHDLAWMYHEGEGVPADRIKAYIWIWIASIVFEEWFDDGEEDIIESKRQFAQDLMAHEIIAAEQEAEVLRERIDREGREQKRGTEARRYVNEAKEAKEKVLAAAEKGAKATTIVEAEEAAKEAAKEAREAIESIENAAAEVETWRRVTRNAKGLVSEVVIAMAKVESSVAKNYAEAAKVAAAKVRKAITMGTVEKATEEAAEAAAGATKAEAKAEKAAAKASRGDKRAAEKAAGAAGAAATEARREAMAAEEAAEAKAWVLPKAWAGFWLVAFFVIGYSSADYLLGENLDAWAKVAGASACAVVFCFMRGIFAGILRLLMYFMVIPLVVVAVCFSVAHIVGFNLGWLSFDNAFLISVILAVVIFWRGRSDSFSRFDWGKVAQILIFLCLSAAAYFGPGSAFDSAKELSFNESQELLSSLATPSAGENTASSKNGNANISHGTDREDPELDAVLEELASYTNNKPPEKNQDSKEDPELDAVLEELANYTNNKKQGENRPNEDVNGDPPQKLPPSGDVKWYPLDPSEASLSPPSEALLIITASEGFHYYVKLKDFQSKKDVLGVFVQEGERVEVDVPLGEYHVFYTSGNTWYGFDRYFGSEGRYGKIGQRLGDSRQVTDMLSFDGGFDENNEYWHTAESIILPPDNGDVIALPVSDGDF